MIRLFVSATLVVFVLSHHVRAESDIIIQNKTYNSGVVATEWSELTIETSGTVWVKAGANVSFATGETILLEPGFTVQAGGVFWAKPQSSPAYNPGGYYSASPLISLLSGGNQFGLTGSFNAEPFDIIVWNAAGTAPLANAPVLVTIDSGSGWLATGNTPESTLKKTVTATSDNDGSVLVYYKHGATAYEKATISAIARDARLNIYSFTVAGGDLDSDLIPDINDQDIDGDLLPNNWETQYGLNPFLVSPNEDHDQDLVKDYIEYHQGRNPAIGAVSDTQGVIKLRLYAPNN